MEDVTINTKHEQGILEAIQKHPIFCFNDIFVYYEACSRSTAYAHGLDKSDNIKEAIYKNRRKGVTSLKAKWLKSENATLQLAVMRMICDPEEHKTLNQNYTDITTGGVSLNIDPFAKIRQNVGLDEKANTSD